MKCQIYQVSSYDAIIFNFLLDFVFLHPVPLPDVAAVGGCHQALILLSPPLAPPTFAQFYCWWKKAMDLGASENDSIVTEFVLLGLTEAPALQPILFIIFLLTYVAAVGGNVSILAAILAEPKLHNPMYFFLGNLSLLDVRCISVTVPAMLRSLMSNNRAFPTAPASPSSSASTSWQARTASC